MTTENGYTPRDDRPARRHSRVRRTRIRSGFGAKLLITLAVVAAVFFSIAIFFRVNTVTVRGNSIYDTQTVMSASGLKKGDSLLALNRSAMAARIEVALPYVESVRIALALPDRVILEITESEIVYGVETDTGENWLMNYKGKLLEPVTEEAAQNYPAVTGFTVTQPRMGEAAVSSTPESLANALKVLENLRGTGLMEHIVRIDAEKSYDITLWYTDRFEIRFGTAQELEHKVQFLQVVLEQLMDYQSGVIDLTLEEKNEARFMPW